MIGLTTIVVPLDGSPFSERALPYAIELAQASGARVILVRAAEPPLSLELAVDPVDAKFDALDLAESELGATMARLDSRAVTIEPHVYSGGAAQVIIDAARLNQAGLIVMATHGRSGVGRWLYGSVADRVIRNSHIPVLLVPMTCETGWPPDQVRRILVGLDGSALAEEVLEHVAVLAKALAAELLLVRAVQGENPNGLTVSARAYLDQVAERLRSDGAKVQVLSVEGHAAGILASVAREMDARIIAMATHGRNGLARYVLGSVATETLHRATTPLLVVRPSEVSRQALAPAIIEETSDGETLSLTVTTREARLLTEAVELLLSTTVKEEHLAAPLHRLIGKLTEAKAEPATPAAAS